MKKITDMEHDWWMTLPLEVRKALVQKRMEAAKKYQGTITCEKYGVYAREETESQNANEKDNLELHNLNGKDMEEDWWDRLPVEVKKALAQKRREAVKKYQGSITCEKYGVYMRP